MSSKRFIEEVKECANVFFGAIGESGDFRQRQPCCGNLQWQTQIVTRQAERKEPCGGFDGFLARGRPRCRGWRGRRLRGRDRNYAAVRRFRRGPAILWKLLDRLRDRA